MDDVPNSTMCTDGELVRVGFMTPNSVQDYIEFLETNNLQFQTKKKIFKFLEEVEISTILSLLIKIKERHCPVIGWNLESFLSVKKNWKSLCTGYFREKGWEEVYICDPTIWTFLAHRVGRLNTLLI